MLQDITGWGENDLLGCLMLQDITGWGENDRGVSFTFGGDVVRQFLKKHNFSLIVRAHQASNLMT